MNILAIGAHFDDIELGCGGAIAQHVDKGDTVYIYIATLSGYNNPNNTVIRSNEAARTEGIAGAKILGAQLICGVFPTFEIEFNDELNRQIVNLVEEKQIDMVYTHWLGDIHHDHQAIARASLHASRHVPNVLMYRSNWYPSASEFRGDFYVDITNYWEKKEEAMRTHKSEIDRIGSAWVDYFKREAENAGMRIGVKYAEVFEVVKLLVK